MTANSRPYWWISLALLFLSSGLAAVFLGPSRNLPVHPRAASDRNWLRIVYARMLQPDPHIRLFPVSVNNLFILSLWEPLVECDPVTGEPQPAAARSWEWSADRKVLTLRLQPDARWSNGDPVTADDFVRGWRRLLKQRLELAYTLFPIRGAEAFHRGKESDPAKVGVSAVDAATLRIELVRPHTTFVAELADPLLAPMHATSDQVLRSQSYRQQPSLLVTNGPFRLSDFAGDGIRLEKCPFYHDAASVRLAGVHFIETENLSFGATLVESGRADLVTPLNYIPATVRTARPTEIESELVLGVTALSLNTTRGPLRDVRVRRALALALKRDAMAPAAERTQMVPALSWVPDFPGRTGLHVLTEDADEARRLLAEAGYPGGRGFPVLQMPMPMWMYNDPYIASCVDRWFKELGIKTYVAYRDPPAHVARLNAGDYDIITGTLFATVPDAGDLLSTFQMPPENSDTKWSDKETVTLLEEANGTEGPARLALLEKAERRAMMQAPVIPLLFERRLVLRAAEVRGWYADPLARQTTRRLWLAEPEDARAPAAGPRQ